MAIVQLTQAPLVRGICILQFKIPYTKFAIASTFTQKLQYVVLCRGNVLSQNNGQENCKTMLQISFDNGWSLSRIFVS